jgi:1-acyl-sn-glycerol-3-phosphate acyltransferase
LTTEAKLPKVPKREKTLLLAIVAGILAPLIRLMMRIRTQGIENLPKGGYILVANHVNYLDPLAFAYAVYIHLKRTPHYLAKEPLFRIPIIGSLLPKLGQIPVYRGGKSNDQPLKAAVEFLKAGQVVVVFPEGTLTRDPNQWPMRGKSGAIRLAIELGLPIVPAGHWGIEKILGTYTKRFRPNPFHTVNVKIGKPMTFPELQREGVSSQEMNLATDKVMKEIASIVGELRGETPPAELWDPAKNKQSETGNFRKNS